jgi:DNA-binding NarL/FixJ family response regulator
MIAKQVVPGERVRVSISAPDPISRDGIASLLRGQSVEIVDEGMQVADAVALLVVHEIDEAAVREIRSIRMSGRNRVVLVAARIDDAGLLAAVQAGVGAILRREAADARTVRETIGACAAGDGTMPPDLLGRLLDHVSTLQHKVLAPRGLTLTGLSEREIRVLRLLADGLDTAEVGRALFCSERTVKYVVHDVTCKLNLRNRTHAVAYALRCGLI